MFDIIFSFYFTLLLAVIFALFVVLFSLLSRRKILISDDLHLIGSVGTVETALIPRGSVIINGELWPVVAINNISSHVLGKGQQVRVSGLHGLVVEVTPLSSRHS